MADATLAERVREAAGAHLRAAADEVLDLPFGWAVRTPTLPAWRDLNMVVVDRPAPALDAETLAERCAALLPAAGDRVAEVWEPEDARRLAPSGWARDPFAMLVHEGPVPISTPWAVTEVGREAVAPLRRAWLAADGLPRPVLDEAARAELRMFTRTPTRAFAVLQGGAPVACALLVGAGPVRMVEDVYVVPAARRRGLAAAVVTAVTARAYADDAQVVWLATDERGPARRVYERCGYRRVLGAVRCVPEAA